MKCTCRDLLLPGKGATEGLAMLASTLTNDPEAEKSKLFSSVARLSTTERTLLFPLPMKNMGFLVSARARFWCCLFLQVKGLESDSYANFVTSNSD